MDFKTKEKLRTIIRHTPQYLLEKRRLRRGIDLEKSVRQYLKDVPFYKDYGQYLKEPFSITDFPILRKCDIAGRERELVSSEVFKHLLRKEETGGSTGVSMEVYRTVTDIARETAFVDTMFGIIGNNLNIAVMRGQKPKLGGVLEKISGREILLSSQGISIDTVDEYLDILERYHINCLYAYPSSVAIFSRIVRKKYGTRVLKDLKGVVTSSEVLDREDKEIILSTFPGIHLVDYYGMSERCCAAYSVDLDYYHFLPAYGYCEFIDTGDRKNGHEVAEIVATSIMNTTWPLIRYGTDDQIEMDENGNVVAIIGRSSDYVVNKKEALVPCIMVNRNESMENVLNFQYYQDKPGCLEFHVIVSPQWNARNKQMLTEDLINSFDHLMDCKVVVVDSIPKTKRGKQKRLIQKVNIETYK